MDPDTIIAVCTPPGRGGIGVVRLSGPDAVTVAKRIFAASLEIKSQPRTVVYGHVVADDGQRLDDGLAWYMPGPNSYSGEDTVEISANGSRAVMQLLVDRGCDAGARLAEPGEFTRRAFLNGRLDLLQAEAVADLIETESIGGLHAAYGVLSGALSERVREVQRGLVDVVARTEALLDFAEDVADSDVGDVSTSVFHVEQSIETLLNSFAGARRQIEGYRVVLVGRPNAGKSTLFNALLGEERSIVDSAAGTTRDWVEGRVVWGGHQIRLIDTAGLHETDDMVERQGVDRTERQMEGADLLLVVDDAGPDGAPDVPADIASIAVTSKADLHAVPPPGLSVSATQNRGLDALRQAISTAVGVSNKNDAGAPLRDRHRKGFVAAGQACRDARRELVAHRWELAAHELRTALAATEELLGRDASEDVLDRIFSQFCIGK